MLKTLSIYYRDKVLNINKKWIISILVMKNDKIKRYLADYFLNSIDNKNVISPDNYSLAPLIIKLLTRSSPALVLFPSAGMINEVYDILKALIGLLELKHNVVKFPEIISEKNRYLLINESEKLSVLREIVLGNNYVYLASISSCFEKLESPTQFIQRCFELKIGEIKTIKEIITILDGYGYDNEYQVENVGQFSQRGGLLDIYSPVEKAPVRIEFFDNEIESMRIFTTENQLSIKKINSYKVAAMSCNAVENEKNFYLIDYFPQMPQIISIHPADSIEILKKHELFEKIDSFLLLRSRKDLNISEILNVSDLVNYKDSENGAYSDILSVPLEQNQELTEETAVIGFELYEQIRVDQIKYWLDNSYKITVLTSSETSKKQVLLWLAKNNLQLKITVEEGFLPLGFIIKSLKRVVLTEREIFYTPFQHKIYSAKSDIEYESENKKDTHFITLNEIELGDYVVHSSHGVGLYHGIKEIESAGSVLETLEIEYEDEILLHVPIWQAGQVFKYIGTGKTVPTLSKLGSKKWNTVKASAKQAVKELASDMLRIQTLRGASSGYAFFENEPEQRSFESLFPYTETADQLKVAEEIKKDMLSVKPMDRLICGDVGYGKTELAIRAAFRAVMNGKQVIILAPTTILAQQHFYTFQERFSHYPIIIEMISRFRTVSEQNKIIEDLKKHRVDIVIGTHRLIQPDVIPNDLGLIIIDEEQRFGVIHKEFLKRMRATVDIITMTATPIPRTLYFSMAGLRDLSVVMTPPVDRLPIQTIICKYDENIIKTAIQTEVERGGQVYFLHNRVKTIEQKLEQLKKLLPDVKFALGHGQMDEIELENVISHFIKGDIDVLICTTIIESGVDIPNANTIMIERADRFGLAELYQLRGRVGRWRRQAYAYLLLPQHEVLTGSARERIAAMRKYSQLGAGFKLAMKDLEIRGSGNLLGSQQSGHINAIGFDLYCQLLKISVAALKGNNSFQFMPNIDIFFDFVDFALHTKSKNILACIPKTYIEFENERLNFYRKLTCVGGFDDFLKIKIELEDRFGALPVETDNLISVMKIIYKVAAIGYNSIKVKNEHLFIEGIMGKQFTIKGKIPKLKAFGGKEKLIEIYNILDDFENKNH